MDKVRASWEDRAAAYGDELAGVLFRGLPIEANQAIHEWHAWLVRDIFLPTIPMGGRVLDLGCGYGRLADTISVCRNDIVIVGQDLAFEYCRRFKRNDRQCVQGNALQLPFAERSFNGIVAVTSLMYLPRTEVTRALINLRKLLLPNGRLLIVDPGREIQRLAAMRRSSSSQTGGTGFELKEYVEMAEVAGYSLLEKGGNSRFSRALFLHVIAKSKYTLALLKREAKCDYRTGGYKWSAFHRWLLASVDDSAPRS